MFIKIKIYTLQDNESDSNLSTDYEIKINFFPFHTFFFLTKY